MTNVKTHFGVLIIEVTICIVSSAKLTQMTKLFNEVFDENYNPNAPPSKPVKVGMRAQLEEIRDIDDVNEILVTRVRVHVWWRDKRLQWSKEKYRIFSILAPPHAVWKPDIALMNDISELSSLGAKSSPIWIRRHSNELHVQWSPVSIFETKCIFDLEYYPFDTQHCEIKLGTLSSYERFIKFDSLECMKLNGTFETSTWSLEAIHKYESDFVFNYEVFRKQRILTCVYTLKRKSSYYVTNILLPLLFLGLMNPLAFLIPCHSGEKISFAITLFLAFAVYETIILQKVPVNSDKVSYLQLYVIVQLAFTVFILVTSIVQTRLYVSLAENPSADLHDQHSTKRNKDPGTTPANNVTSENRSLELELMDMAEIIEKKDKTKTYPIAIWKRLPCMTKVDIISFLVVLVSQVVCNAYFYVTMMRGPSHIL